VLRRARNIRAQIGPDNVVRVVRHDESVECGPRGLGILDAFARPIALGEALQRLEPSLAGTEDWMDVTGTILRLYQTGVLKNDEGASPVPVDDGSFGDPTIHAMMLNDRARTSGFLQAIERVVRPGDVVVDIGTGTGVLAVAAVRAGARRVYAIEAGAMLGVARQIIDVNGVSSQVTLIEGWSTQVSLPERANVLVAEIIGEIPFQERVLEVTRDARSRLLEDGARLIPGRLRIYGLPVAIPDDLLATRVVTSPAVDRWKGWYGMDFGPLGGAARGLRHVLLLDPASARSLPAISEPLLLADVDLGAFDEVSVATEETTIAADDGELNGVLVHFELELAPGLVLSTDPRTTMATSSWRNPVWIFNEAITLRTGDAFGVRFSYRAPGESNGVRIDRR
jgi:hypothetical protein